MSRRHERYVIALAFLTLAACTRTPSAPTSRVDRIPYYSLMIACVASPTLKCTASLDPGGIVTANATWSAAESFKLATDLPVTSSSAVVFRSPGVPTALRAQNVYIRADYDSPEAGHLKAIAPHAYALDPAGDAVPLAYLSGIVYAGGTDHAVVGGASVEIIDGEGTGKRDVTREYSGFYLIEFLRLNLPFTARASKAGYSTDVRQHPGIVDSVFDYPSNDTMSFTIDPK